MGNGSKANVKLGWKPQIDTRTLCKEMAHHDLKEAKRLAFLKHNGFDCAMSSEG